MGILAFLLSSVMNVLMIVWLVACGFFGVFFYTRRTGQALSVSSGAHLGWLAGLFVFAPGAVFTPVFLSQLKDPEILEKVRAQAGSQFSEAEFTLMMDALRSPLGITVLLLTLFILFTALPAFGGALGAKAFGNHGRPADQGNA
jgi:hypothetical protein